MLIQLVFAVKFVEIVVGKRNFLELESLRGVAAGEAICLRLFASNFHLNI